MELEHINIVVNGIKKRIKEGTLLLELSREIQKDNEPPIVLAIMNHKLCELTQEIKKNANIKMITTAHKDGLKVYKRSVCFLMIKAVFDVFGKDVVKKVIIHHSLSKGYYCEIIKDQPLNQNDLNKIKQKMKYIIAKDIPIQKRTVRLDEAIDIFKNNKMYDKVKLFNYRKVSNVNLYKIDDIEDYFYGYMLPSTSYINYFDLFLYNEGLVLQFPTTNNPLEVPPFDPPSKLFSVLKQSIKWGKRLGVDTVGALNDMIAKGKMNELIMVSEALQEKRIAEIADNIVSNKDKKFVLIAGPSSSGKTTFSNRLSIQLKVHGVNPHLISIDDYFVNRELTPIDEDGNYNFEALEAIDIVKFNEDMNKLLKGECIKIPSFNFKSGKREYKGKSLQLGSDDLLVIEGIHGLNDKLSHSLPQESKFKIYLSALTQLNIDEHNRISTTDGRLIRRIIRDNSYRGAMAQNTIAMWPSVRRGEEKYIFPFQEDADVMFNSALLYELAILKPYVEPLLFSIPRDSEEYIEAKRLIKFLDYFLGVSSEDVPKNSIIREFIGGSCFR